MLALALGIGCGAGDNGENVANAAEPADPRPLVEAVAAAQCRSILSCCSGSERESVLGPEIADQGECEAAIVSQSEAFLLPALQRALGAGSIELRDSQIEGCIGALDARMCGEFRPLASADVLRLAGCSEVLEPKLTLSGFCTDDFECDTGFCSHPPADTQGTCKNPSELGQPCLHDRCASELTCSPDGMCVEKLEDDEVCTRNSDCTSDVCAPDADGVFVCLAVTPICTG